MKDLSQTHGFAHTALIIKHFLGLKAHEETTEKNKTAPPLEKKKQINCHIHYGKG